MCHCVKPETPPFLAGVELFGERVVLTPFKMITVVERPGRDSTGSRRAAVEHAALMGTSQASDKSCQPWWCQPGPDHFLFPGCHAKTALPQIEARTDRSLMNSAMRCPLFSGVQLPWHLSPPRWHGRAALAAPCPPRRWAEPRRWDARRTLPTSGGVARTASSSPSSAHSWRRLSWQKQGLHGRPARPSSRGRLIGRGSLRRVLAFRVASGDAAGRSLSQLVSTPGGAPRVVRESECACNGAVEALDGGPGVRAEDAGEPRDGRLRAESRGR